MKKKTAKEIISAIGMENRPLYYSGRGTDLMDLNGSKLKSIYLEIKNEIGADEAENFVMLVKRLNTLETMHFLNALYLLETNDWKYDDKIVFEIDKAKKNLNRVITFSNDGTDYIRNIFLREIEKSQEPQEPQRPQEPQEQQRSQEPQEQQRSQRSKKSQEAEKPSKEEILNSRVEKLTREALNVFEEKLIRSEYSEDDIKKILEEVKKDIKRKLKTNKVYILWTVDLNFKDETMKKSEHENPDTLVDVFKRLNIPISPLGHYEEVIVLNENAIMVSEKKGTSPKPIVV